MSEVNLETAWAEVKRLVSVNAQHRRGFRLAEIANNDFVLRQAEREMDELIDANERLDDGLCGTDQHVAEELGDVLGVLFHFGIRMGYTPETLARTMLAKFKQRFVEPDLASLSPLATQPREKV